MAYIRVDQAIPVFDGQPVTFKSPANCSGIDGLKVYYPAADGTAVATFALADAHGNNVGSINLFAANVLVKVILDTESGMAFVQNADTNAYLEGRFEELERSIVSTVEYMMFVQDDEPPEDAREGSIWIDTDEEVEYIPRSEGVGF